MLKNAFHFVPDLRCTLSDLTLDMVKSLPARWETWVRSLGWDDPLEKEMSTYSSILAWRIPWMEESSGLWSLGLQKVVHD